MRVIDNVAFIDFVKAFYSELNNDLQKELPTDSSNEVKSVQHRMPKLACDTNENNLTKSSFLSSVLLNA